MKKIFLIFLLIPILGVTSCVKQKNCEGCDNEKVGWIQYVNEPVIDSFYTNHGRVKVTALFYENINDEWGFPITGNNIPKKYKSCDLIRVRVCLALVEKAGKADHIPASKITCIEKED